MTRPRGELVTDMTHFLDERGCIAPESGPARRLAEHLAAIVVMITSDPFGPQDGAPGSVRCRRRHNHRACTGYIDVDLGVPHLDADDADVEILWWCKRCDDHGTIRRWQKTFWDMTDMPPTIPRIVDI